MAKEIRGPLPVRASIGCERGSHDDPGCRRVGTGRSDGHPIKHFGGRRNRGHPSHNRYGAQGGAEFVKRSCVRVRTANRLSRLRNHPLGPGKKGLLLPRLLGRQRAALALLASEWLSAEEAVAAGLALRVCAPGAVVPETVALAERIASFPPEAVALIKRLMGEADRESISLARTREEAAFAALFADPDRNPGDPIRMQIGFGQRLVDSRLIGAERAAALQQ